VFADDGAILGFGQSVVVAVPGRLLVCSMSSLFSNRATMRLMNSLPLSEWKPIMRKGNCRIRAHSTGSSQASLMRSVAATISHCVT
jgi:hypothetical protein